MNTFKAALLAGFVLAASASGASAGAVIITDVETGNGDFGNVSVGPYGNPWTTPILMTDSKGQTYVVFCDDLQHDVNVGGGQNLPYHTGLVTQNGFGQTISETISNEMGQLADIGRYDYLHGNEAGAIAAQAAIWSLEYNTSASSSDPTVEADLQTLMSNLHDNGRGYATGLIADAGTQSMIFGGVPEPATWAMMILGVAMIGFAARRRAAGAATAVTAA